MNLENNIQVPNEVLFSHRSEKCSNANNFVIRTDQVIFHIKPKKPLALMVNRYNVTIASQLCILPMIASIKVLLKKNKMTLMYSS